MNTCGVRTLEEGSVASHTGGHPRLLSSLFLDEESDPESATTLDRHNRVSLGQEIITAERVLEYLCAVSWQR